MQREILFRGQMTTGQWVEGWLLKDSPNSTAYYDKCPYRIVWYSEDGAHCNAPVVTNTIGQFTGFIDKNKKKIFEGDIVRGDHVLDAEDMVFTEHMSVNDYSCSWIINGFSLPEDCREEDCEVIGNIHDNK